MLRKFRSTRSSPETVKLKLEDFILYTFYGLMSGFLAWFTLRDTGWLAYLTAFAAMLFAITLSIPDRKEKVDENE